MMRPRIRGQVIFVPLVSAGVIAAYLILDGIGSETSAISQVQRPIP